MKILTAQQIRKIDELTIKNTPISSFQLMERAATAAFSWIYDFILNSKYRYNIVVVCGPGNNGGDGISISRRLIFNGFDTKVFVISQGKLSKDCKSQLDILAQYTKSIKFIKSQDDVAKLEEVLNPPILLIDAIFGTGLKESPTDVFASVINTINRFKLKYSSNLLNSQFVVISIDIPSGLFCDDNSNNKGPIIQADFTLSFQIPKLCFFLPYSGKFVNQWILLPIGLLDDAIESENTNYYCITPQVIRSFLRGRSLWSHKGTYGHTLLIGGSIGKGGAIIMAGKAAAKVGSGLTTIRAPQYLVSSIASIAPECMVSPDSDNFIVSDIPPLKNFTSIAIGPGLGVYPQTKSVVKKLIYESSAPLVFDADALNILAEEKTWLEFLPPNTILTPHPGEFKRLFGTFASEEEELSFIQNFSVKKNVIIVLKRRHTLIALPNGKCFFNTTGNPSLAKGGSGDVLTGVIAGLISRGYPPHEAAMLGTFLHGLASDIFAKENNPETLLPLDIISYLTIAFNYILY